MWSYIGEKYVFNCEKCDKFEHVDNRDVYMKETFTVKTEGEIGKRNLLNFKRDLHNIQVKHNIHISLFDIPKD